MKMHQDPKKKLFQNYEEKDEAKMFVKPSYHGLGFEFLSLDDPENLISWLEIRSYAYVKGRQLFAELELFILFFCVCMIIQAGYIVLTLFNSTDSEDQVSDIISATFVCVTFMLIINFGWMIKVFILGTKFDQFQRRQQYALVNQLMCIRSEAITTALFTGPIGWMELSVGKWKKLYELIRERAGQYIIEDDKQRNQFVSKFDCNNLKAPAGRYDIGNIDSVEQKAMDTIEMDLESDDGHKSNEVNRLTEKIQKYIQKLRGTG